MFCAKWKWEKKFQLTFLMVSCWWPKWSNPEGKSHTGPEFTALLPAASKCDFLSRWQMSIQINFLLTQLVVEYRIHERVSKSETDGASKQVNIASVFHPMLLSLTSLHQTWHLIIKYAEKLARLMHIEMVKHKKLNVLHFT